MSLKESVKTFAYKLGADLVGFGGIDRARNAPPKMSPQGVFPGAKTVLVMALHHPDACIDLGGELHPQTQGPYSIQWIMNYRLDELSYRMASFLEDQGYGAIPIVSSNIWRYNNYKDLKAVFAPDVSHIYMAVVAGLAEMGYNGLALTPEYGARNRFVTVITDAEIEPDPLVKPGTVCDHCMLCRQHCPSGALFKEIDGENVLEIGEYEYRFANKNLWRCAWGEHFDLSLDLEIPEKVTEEAILDAVAKYGIHEGEMGQCVKYCLPKKYRSWDKSYSKSPLRKPAVALDENLESRSLTDKLLNACHADGAEHVVVQSAATLKELGMDIDAVLPGAVCAITLARQSQREAAGRRKEYSDAAYGYAAGYNISSAAYDLARGIDELGFRAVVTAGAHPAHPTRGYPGEPGPAAWRIREIIFGGDAGNWESNTVFSRKNFPERPLRLDAPGDDIRVNETLRATENPTDFVKKLAREAGADLVGVASRERIDLLAAQLKPAYEGQTLLRAVDRSVRFTPWKPEFSENPREIFTTDDYLPGARSVIVLGMRIHQKVVEFAGKPPAEAGGPYAFENYVTILQGNLAAAKLSQKLRELGYRAAITPDLMGLGETAGNPRGMIDDLFCNRFAALAAGLGGLTLSGRVFTPEYGLRQRFIAVVTDAPFAADPISAATPSLCADCGEACVAACPVAALGREGETVAVELEGVRFEYRRLDTLRCDWSKRYALMADEGNKFVGGELTEPPPEKIDRESLTSALEKHDRITKYRPVACEPCIMNCPYARAD